MSFLQKAREAAEQVAGQAKAAAEGVHVPGMAAEPGAAPGTESGDRMSQALASAGHTAREAMGMARKGISTVVEKIDPGTLAELIVKATALQEKTNSALRTKRSPYRISEIVISASIPPAVSFTIGRIDDLDDGPTGTEVASTELVDQVDSGEAVLALDGATGDA